MGLLMPQKKHCLIPPKECKHQLCCRECIGGDTCKNRCLNTPEKCKKFELRYVYQPKEYSRKNKLVVEQWKDGVMLKKYESLKSASRANGKSETYLSVKRRIDKLGNDFDLLGYHWRIIPCNQEC